MSYGPNPRVSFGVAARWPGSSYANSRLLVTKADLPLLFDPKTYPEPGSTVPRQQKMISILP